MKKILYDILIVGGVVFAYIFMAAFQPGTNALISTANASTNWTNFESTQAIINAYPLWSWFIPGLVGIIAFVVNHKSNPS